VGQHSPRSSIWEPLFAQQEQQLVTKLPPRDSPSFFLLENLIVIKTSLVLPTGTSPCNPTNRKTWTAIERRKTTKAKLGNTLGNLERFVSFFFFFSFSNYSKCFIKASFTCSWEPCTKRGKELKTNF
jgi:hypothetical protein